MRLLSIAVLLVVVTACSEQQSLSDSACNGLVDQWNKNARGFAAYRQATGYFRAAVVITNPTKSSKQVMVAKVGTEIFDSVTSPPSIETDAFESVPPVQLHLNDVRTDIATLISKIRNAELENFDGTRATETNSAGLSFRDVLLDSKPGESAGAAFDAFFGSTIDRMNSDFSKAFDAMRSQYQAQCKGDPAEVRPLTDF